MNIRLNEYYVGLTRAMDSIGFIGDNNRVRYLHSSKVYEECERVRKQIMDQRGFTDTRTRGWSTCPNCGNTYRMKYRSKEDAPVGSIWCEQHITGVCSDKCWDEFLGVKQRI